MRCCFYQTDPKPNKQTILIEAVLRFVHPVEKDS